MATKRKVKRFNGEDDSLALADENYGDNTTREERLAMVRPPEIPRNRNEGTPAPMDAMEAANQSKEAQAIMDQAKGEAILKRIRDEAPRKAPVVTKEQLAASGLSLRDYLNKQQGLTRRGESASAESRPAQRRSETSESEARPSRGRTVAGMAPKMTVGKTYPSNPARLKDKDAPFETFTFKKGGAVSASKRADGIAQRGKTRGKIC